MRRLTWALDYVTGTVVLKGLETSTGFDMLVGATGSLTSLLPVVREVTPFARCKQVSQVPEQCWLLSNDQRSSYRPG